MEITIDGKNYVPHEEYKKLFDKVNKVTYENKQLNARIDVLKRENDNILKQLDHFIEFPDCKPITVASVLISAKRTFDETGMHDHGFDKGELRQIAGHLLVYCNDGRK